VISFRSICSSLTLNHLHPKWILHHSSVRPQSFSVHTESWRIRVVTFQYFLQHIFCYLSSSCTSRTLPKLANKESLGLVRPCPQATPPSPKNWFSGLWASKTQDRRPDAHVCFLIFCRQKLEAPTQNWKTDLDKKWR
jgi:hypothetical protein